MNHRSKNLVEKINDLSCAIEGLCNLGWHIEKELYGHDIYIYGGKIFKSSVKWEKQFEKGAFEVEYDEDSNPLPIMSSPKSLIFQGFTFIVTS